MEAYVNAIDHLRTALDGIAETINILEDTGDLDWADMLVKDYDNLRELYRDVRARERATGDID